MWFYFIRNCIEYRLSWLEKIWGYIKNDITIPYMYRAGIVINHPTEDAVLMVCDSRNNLWSFPKGGHESYDSSQLSTAIREVREETGFVYRKDYDVLRWLDIVDIHSYVFFRGIAIHSKLPFKTCTTEYVKSVAWIPLSGLQKLRMNYVSFVACQRFNLI